MSMFLSPNAAALTPYVPGEQPRDAQYIKLNTNECPYPPGPRLAQAVRGFDCGALRLYPDPDATALKAAAARAYGLKPGQVFCGAGSDEVLAYAFMAFCQPGERVWLPDITYGFYRVYAGLFDLKAMEIPLDSDFRIRTRDYADADGPLFIANPNAPTGLCLCNDEIEALLRQNPRRLLVLDEAYADFSPGMSCVGLIDKHPNLLVVHTASKSRALAGLRLGFGFGSAELIAGLERIKFSFNPYNLSRITVAAGIAALEDRAYTDEMVGKVISTRRLTFDALQGMGFNVAQSEANFLFASYPGITGEELYRRLRESGILVRHFNSPRISNYIRVSIGTDAEMDSFLGSIRRIIGKEEDK